MVNTRSTDYDEMANFAEIMKFLENQERSRQEQEAKITQILENQERNRQQDKEEQERIRQEQERIRKEDQTKISQILENQERIRQEQETKMNKFLENQDRIRQQEKEEQETRIRQILEEQARVRQEDKQEVDQKLEKVDQKLEKVQESFDQKIQLIEEKMLQTKAEVPLRRSSNEIQNGVVNPLKIEAPKFDGKQSWSTYKKQFDAAALASGWSDEEKATALILALRGDALEILNTVTGGKPSYEILVDQLERRYGDQHLQQVYQAHLKYRQQRYDETLQQYETDIVRLVRLAYPTAPRDFIDRLTVQTFIDGLRDFEIQQALRLSGLTRIEDALARALEYEAAKQASRSHLHRGQIRRVSLIKEVKYRKSNIIKQIIEILRKLDGQSTGHSSQRVCWNCGQGGHIKRNCSHIQSINVPGNFSTPRVCWNCEQEGHMKKNCPLLTGHVQENFEIRKKENCAQQKYHYCSNKDSSDIEPGVKREDVIPRSKESSISRERSSSRKKSLVRRRSISRCRRCIRQCVGSSGRGKSNSRCSSPQRGAGDRRCFGRNRRKRMRRRSDRDSRRNRSSSRNIENSEIGEGCMATKDHVSLCRSRSPVRVCSPGGNHSPVKHFDDHRRGSRVPPSNLSSSWVESEDWDKRIQGAPPDEIVECIGMMFDRDDQI